MAKQFDKSKLKGVASLTVTALNNDYTLNEDANRAELDWLLERGVTSAWFRGFIGEWPQLEMGISKQLIKVYGEHGKGRALMGAGCHGTRTSECIELANYADKVGCDFAWITPPPHPSSGTMEDVLRHYKMIVDNTDIPLAIYNSAAMFVYLSPRNLLEVINLAPDRFVAIKDSYGIMSHHTEMYRVGVPKKSVFIPMASDMMLDLMQGAESVMCMPHQVPMLVACLDAFKKGDMEKAWKLQYRLVEGEPLLGLTSMVLRPRVAGNLNISGGRVKAMLTMLLGIEMGPPAPPIHLASKEDIEQVKKYIDTWKPLDVDAPLITN